MAKGRASDDLWIVMCKKPHFRNTPSLKRAALEGQQVRTAPWMPAAVLCWMLALGLMLPACTQHTPSADAVRIMVASGGEWVPYLHSEQDRILQYTAGFTGRTKAERRPAEESDMADFRMLYYQNGSLHSTLDCYVAPGGAFGSGQAFAVRRTGSATEVLRLKPEALAFHTRAKKELESGSTKYKTNAAGF